MIDKGMKLADIGKPEMVPARDGYGKALVELGEENKDVVVLTGDLSESTRVQWFQEKFPDRFFEVGVAEQNMVGLAAGLALNGKIPFVSSYAVFCPGRAWDQTRNNVLPGEYSHRRTTFVCRICSLKSPSGGSAGSRHPHPLARRSTPDCQSRASPSSNRRC